jgi:hypothetical protein
MWMFCVVNFSIESSNANWPHRKLFMSSKYIFISII